jgi:hypothetical protein
MKRALALALLAACAGPRPALFREQWVEVTSESFAVESDLDQFSAGDAARQLEFLKERLVRAMPVALPQQPRLQVVLFATAEELHGYVPEAAGVFQRDLGGGERILLSDRLGPALRLVIAHELTHQLAAYALKRQPRWFSEGLAMRLSDVATGLVSTQFASGALTNASMPARDLFAWREPLPKEARRLYVTAWLLIEMLDQSRHEEFVAYLQRLAQGADPAESWNAIFHQWTTDDAGLARSITWARFCRARGASTKRSAPTRRRRRSRRRERRAAIG